MDAWSGGAEVRELAMRPGSLSRGRIATTSASLQNDSRSFMTCVLRQ
jgi:hypothetical protein